MKATLIAALGLSVGLSGVASAQPYYHYGHSTYAPSGQIQAEGPAEILNRGLQTLIAFVGAQERPDERQIARFLEQRIVPHFDFMYMARWAAGKAWRRMNQQQRVKMESELKKNFLGALTRRLTAYGGQQVRILRSRRGRGNEMTVGVAVQNPRGYPARLDFRFYRADDGWKVFDVSANGSSALVHYRNHFRKVRSTQPRRAGVYSPRAY